MCPCDPNTLNINIPSAPTGPAIPGFGTPFSPEVPSLNLSLPGVPDLMGLFKLLSFPLPFGELKGALNPNFGKDIMDQVIKLLDQFMPFLMFYKFFLPVLKLILCILEIVCALPNPVKVAIAIQRLFRECIPLFLALFPIIAIIIMIISLLILLAQIIIYLVNLVVNFIKLVIKNILVLYDAFKIRNLQSIKAAIEKIGRIICLFQNLFVILSMIDLIIQVFKSILNGAFTIPPCDDSDNSNFQNCCTPDVCPKFIKNGDFIRSTGSIYYNSSAVISGAAAREEGIQFYDDASIAAPVSDEFKGTYVSDVDAGENYWLYQQFINMISPKDPNYETFISKYIEAYGSSPVFFPTDGTYNASSQPGQAPYLVDMEFDYDPSYFGRVGAQHGVARKIKFKNCVVTKQTSSKLLLANKQSIAKTTGVIKIAGGLGYEEDGTPLMGYDKEVDNNFTLTDEQATLETFLFLTAVDATSTLNNVEKTDYLKVDNVKYTFRINHNVLVSKNIITYSCMPAINQDRSFTNAVFSSDLNLKIAELQNFPFPDAIGAQQCMLLALDAFRNDVTEDGAEILQNTMLACLNQLQEETENAINIAIPLAFDKFKSTVTLSPDVQFTTGKIQVLLDLKESSGSSLVKLLPPGSADFIINKISSSLTLGSISKFTYDGTQYFQAEISSADPGSGELEISFENKKLSVITPENVLEDLTKPLNVSIRKVPYTFIYANAINKVNIGTGDSSDGETPRRDEGDLSREANS